MFEMIEGKNISARSPKSWKNSFNNGVVKPTKMRFCNEFKDKTFCTKCKNQINEIREFEAKLNFLIRKAPNEFGHMLPYFKE